jgi:ATP-dependent Clp protease adaptor protein ClpS
MAEKILTNKELEEILFAELDLSTGQKAEIIVYNDDFNTFDWVIQSLVEICNHTFDQAEQLSILIHFKGKASVKSGSFSILQPLKDSLVERGLSAVIETYQDN